MAKPTPAPYDPHPEWIADHKTETSQRYPDAYKDIHLGAITDCRATAPQSYTLHGPGEVQLKISYYGGDIWRIRYATERFNKQPSYALRPDLKARKSELVCTEDETAYILTADQVSCRIDKTKGLIQFERRGDRSIILAEAEPYLQRSTILKGTHHLRASFAAEKGEAYYGLGDKSWDLDLRGQYFHNWNSDAFGYNKERDPLYRSIPFYYGLKDEMAYGIFLHNTYRSHFDFASRDAVVRMWTEGGEMDYFFCYGPGLNTVAQQYHHLTGTPELPPLWVFGFHQCRWSYYPEARVRQLAATFRELQIPCDAIYLDIDYMDGYRCFTWNKEYFPQPGEMIRDLAADGFHTVVMIDPGIRVDEDYHVYKSGMQQDAFCRRTNGELMRGPVWPPDCVWPDYTRADVREWWGQLYQGLYQDDYVSGFWNDMNEPAVFKVNSLTFPDAVQHDNDGHPSDHRPVHNIYGQQMARATQEGLKSLQPNKRPFVLTRASFSGGQRHAAVWTGDNVASWEHLALANRQCQRLSISGFSLVGTDIGGFVDQPSPELLVRWLQLGAFHPVFRVHSMGNNVDGAAEAEAEEVKASEALNRLDQEPWVFGEPYTSQARKAIEFRYQLLPYLYTSMYQHTQTGLPVLRSLAFVDQTDTKSRARENEFMLGHHLLVSPVVKESAKTHSTYLPQGEWVEFHKGKVLKGRKSHRQNVNADSIPLYVRAGAVLPWYPVQQYTNELDIHTVTLRTYYGTETVESQYYEDAGEGYAYEQGQYALHDFTTHGSKENFRIIRTRRGEYQRALTHFKLQFFGLPKTPTSIMVDEESVGFETNDYGCEVIVRAGFTLAEVRF